MAPNEFPFVPKSNSRLAAGQIWPVPLADGRFAAGVVLDVPKPGDPHVPANTRMFLAGLLSWVGVEPPPTPGITESELLAHGFAHIKAITTTGGAITGMIDVSNLEISETVSHRLGGTVYVYRGSKRIRVATPQESATKPVGSTWGFSFIARVAERKLAHLGEHSGFSASPPVNPDIVQ